MSLFKERHIVIFGIAVWPQLFVWLTDQHMSESLRVVNLWGAMWYYPLGAAVGAYLMSLAYRKGDYDN
jgi:hypothetical protein